MIYLISGTPASGKSSVSKALMQCFSHGVHLPVDDLRQMVVSGIASPIPTWTAETTKQFALARGNAVQIARNYADQGFAVAIDDVFSSQDFYADYVPHLQNTEFKRVLLLPKLNVTLQRNRDRTHKDFPPEFLEQSIRRLHNEYTQMNHEGCIVCDSSNLTLEQTVNTILKLGK